MSCRRCSQQSEVHMQQAGLAVQLLGVTCLSKWYSMQDQTQHVLGHCVPTYTSKCHGNGQPLIHMHDQHVWLQDSRSTKCSRQS